MERVDPTTRLGKLLDWCSRQKATDLHAQADRRYSIRIDGKLQRILEDQFPAPSNDAIVEMLRESFSSSIYERIERQHEMDFSFLCAGCVTGPISANNRANNPFLSESCHKT
jgi:Tfp pilus assembly pilus retraction ATPase PilT